MDLLLFCADDKLQASHDIQKIAERAQTNFGKAIIPQLQEVLIVAYDKCSSGSNGAIYKLVVIGVCMNKVEAIRRHYPFSIASLYYGGDDSFCIFFTARNAHQDFFIF